ncbi:MAG: hypothetical protein IKN74_00155 [Clostridia bacterium]|nr:hypothetical protein [Clostridia bacterium]
MKKIVSKINDESGVTLIMLAITILVLLILAGSSLFIGLNSISKVDDKNQTATLYMVQEVVMGQYSKAKVTGQTGIKVDTSHPENRPAAYFGEIVTNVRNIELPDDDERDATDVFENDYLSLSDSSLTYDDLYYKLRPEELSMLGITDVVIEVQGQTSQDKSIQYRNLHNYIVNYSTGEVYDLTDKKDSTGKLLYIKGNIGTNSETSHVLEDKTYNFDDNL